MKDINTWILAGAMAFGGGMSAWIGVPGLTGLWWWFLTLASGVVLGGLAAKAEAGDRDPEKRGP